MILNTPFDRFDDVQITESSIVQSFRASNPLNFQSENNTKEPDKRTHISPWNSGRLHFATRLHIACSKRESEFCVCVCLCESMGGGGWRPPLGAVCGLDSIITIMIMTTMMVYGVNSGKNGLFQISLLWRIQFFNSRYD